MNTKIGLLTRIAFGFVRPDALISLAMPGDTDRRYPAAGDRTHRSEGPESLTDIRGVDPDLSAQAGTVARSAARQSAVNSYRCFRSGDYSRWPPSDRTVSEPQVDVPRVELPCTPKSAFSW